MLNRFARALFTKLFTPVARLFLRLGISPDVVTVVGTLGVCCRSPGLLPPARVLLGHDRHHALRLLRHRRRGHGADVGPLQQWGAYLDSTLDRVGDSAIFGGLVLCATPAAATTSSWPALALACLILGSVVSYAKARAEGLGMTANVGIAERADRLVAVLVGHRPGRPRPARGRCSPSCSRLLAVASLVTVVQRMLVVRRQAPRPQVP